MELKKEIEADFSTFDPKEYLKEYYARGVDFELDQLLRFFYTSHKDIKPQSTFLEFGIGPTIHSLVTAATKVDTIHVCDRLAANLDEIRLWQRGDEGAFNWDAFIRRSLEIEGIEKVTQDDIQSRSTLLREKLTYFGFCDAFSNPPLLWKPDQSYDVVQVNFVLESITSSLEKWEMALQNIISLLKPQSTLILSALQDSTYYTVHDKRFPAVNIDETLLMSVLIKYGFREENIEMTSVPANLPYRGYGATIFVKALFQ